MKTVLAVLAVGFLTAGCLATKPIPVGTMLLGQVTYVGNGSEAARINPRWIPEGVLDGHPASPSRRESGTTKELMASCSLGDDTASRFALVRLYYQHDIDHSEWAIVDASSLVEPGNIVEVELRQGSANSRCAAIKTIRAGSISAGACVYAVVSKRAFNYYAASLSLRCLDIESEGWKELPDPWAWEGSLNSRLTPNGIGWYKPPPTQPR
jgi:hypothetical protein